ncbi:uncharacterized protein LOC112682171 [Sipha flava]|uniref:Uncharacterized protein LOC112682171 n=1 Tax=Sipha flava TaxID=143950 RepID=A0A2S2Q6N8_9HEMI|nr:uncharacterized protein LOC112682171 [Sipha flava]XP_025408488.1 uncharacterized protein LOC112682171 [Sipha flava]XP_025408495.1 uncharacterized protein LOC112682171 [Sipha flava]
MNETILNSYSLSCVTSKEKKNSNSIDCSSFSNLDVESKQDHNIKYKSNNQNYSLPLKAKRKLFDRNSFSPIAAFPQEHNIYTSSKYDHDYNINKSPMSVISTKGSIITPEKHDLFNLSHSESEISSPKIVEHKRASSTKIIYTSSSPFKVSEATQDTSDYPNCKLALDVNLQSSFKKVSSVIQNKHKLRNNCLSQISESNDIMNKILRVVLKIKYDVETIAQNQIQMDKTLTDTVLQAKDTENISEELLEYDSLLPIESEEQLDEFESK